MLLSWYSMWPLSEPTWLPLRCHETLMRRFAVIIANRDQNESTRRWVILNTPWATLLQSPHIVVAQSRTTAEIHRASQCLMSLYCHTMMYSQAYTYLRHLWNGWEFQWPSGLCDQPLYLMCIWLICKRQRCFAALGSNCTAVPIPRIWLQYSYCTNNDDRFHRSSSHCASAIRYCRWKDYAYHQ